MHRLMRLVETQRIDLTPLFTHTFALEEIGHAYQIFASRSENVLKIAVRV
jgi:alcohol dehydrogenase